MIMQKMKILVLVFMVLLNGGVIYSKTIHHYVPASAFDATKRLVDNDAQRERISQEDESEELQQEDKLQKPENEYDWACRQVRNTLYAGAVIAGTTVMAAATGGIGTFIAIKAGIGITTGAGAGAAVGGVFGTGCGIGMAVSEFEKKKPSAVSRVASEVGKVATLTAVAGPFMGVSTFAEPTTALWAINSVLKLGGFATGYVVGKMVASDSK